MLEIKEPTDVHPLKVVSNLVVGLFPVAPLVVNLPVAALFLVGLQVGNLVQGELLAAVLDLEVLLNHQGALINLNIQTTSHTVISHERTWWWTSWSWSSGRTASGRRSSGLRVASRRLSRRRTPRRWPSSVTTNTYPQPPAKIQTVTTRDQQHHAATYGGGAPLMFRCLVRLSVSRCLRTQALCAHHAHRSTSKRERSVGACARDARHSCASCWLRRLGIDRAHASLSAMRHLKGRGVRSVRPCSLTTSQQFS